jgi:hypothetical protein
MEPQTPLPDQRPLSAVSTVKLHEPAARLGEAVPGTVLIVP